MVAETRTQIALSQEPQETPGENRQNKPLPRHVDDTRGEDEDLRGKRWGPDDRDEDGEPIVLPKPPFDARLLLFIETTESNVAAFLAH